MMNKWGIFQTIYLESDNRASSVPLAPFDVAAGSVEGLKEGWKAQRQILVLESAGSLLKEWQRRK